MADYDIGEAFKSIENELMASMIRNFERHKAEEINEGYRWSAWQIEQLKELERYRVNNKKKFSDKFKKINSGIDDMLRMAKADGEMKQEAAILAAIKRGFKARKASKGATAEFFRVNERKLNALIKATQNDMEKAETAILRMANDRYRKVIFNAQVYANTGAGTYEKAVDMATKDFVNAGYNCIEYANGARHTLSDYADMAIRTASKRAYLQGEGQMRQKWGISTVIMNKRGNPCPKCLPFVGKVLIDDVWSGGKQSDGPYMLMSTAIANGLYHPRCKDSHTTYFPGISSKGAAYTDEEKEQVRKDYEAEQKKTFAHRQAERFGRLALYSLDADNQKMYVARKEQWENALASKEQTEYEDITEQSLSNADIKKYKIRDANTFELNGNTYNVDGKHVLMDYSDKEKKVGEFIGKSLGVEVDMLPRVLYPQNISTADYLIQNERFDLKEPTGSGKNVIYGMVSKKNRQADNFIIDITNCPLSSAEIKKQIGDVYKSSHTKFINKIILIKDYKILGVYKRK